MIMPPVRGYRTWVLREGELRSVWYDHIWTPGTQRAMCGMSFFDHEAPEFYCECGLYTTISVDILQTYWHRNRNGHDFHDNMIAGATKSWGKLVCHSLEGFRSEFMEITALAEPDDLMLVPQVQQIAKYLGVPMVPFEHLQTVGADHGVSLSELAKLAGKIDG